MKIRLLGAHNTESSQTRLVSLLIDGVLAIDAGGLTSCLSFDEQLKLKAIMLTHSHYDHMRDMPALAMNLFLRNGSIQLLTTADTCQALREHLLDGDIYPDFFVRPEDKPTLSYIEMVPNERRDLDGYAIVAVRVGHSVPATGYQVTANGRSMFFTGDTGPGLSECWQRIAPQLLVIEVTAPNRWESFARKSQHLTPGLLKTELEAFRKIKGYLPHIVTVHMNPFEEETTSSEIAEVARSLDASIAVGYEGMVIDL